MDIFSSVKQAIIKTQPGIDAAKITEGALIKEDLEIDSLGMVELALALEETFKFTIPDEELEQVKKVSDIMSLLESKMVKG